MRKRYHPENLDAVVDRNIRALLEMRQREDASLSPTERIAQSISQLIGRPMFVYIHALMIGFWILWNLRILPVQPFDPFPFTGLAALASIETIFLTAFVLVAQNRLTGISEKRADLDVQISLLTEHELTRLIRLTDAIAVHLGLESKDDAEAISAIKEDLPPKQLLEQISRETEDFEKKSKE